MTKNREAKEKKEQHKSSSKLRIIYIILIIIQAFMSGLLLHSLNRLNLLQTWQFWLVTLTLIGLLLLNGYKLIVSSKASRATRIICVVLSIIVTTGSLLGFKYARQTITFVESMTGTHYETQIYQVRVLKNGNYKEISQLSRQHIGFISTNPNLENTKNTLKNTVNYKEKDYEEIGSMVAAIYDFNVAAVVINQSYLDFLQEADTTFIEDTQKIFEFEVRTDAPDERQSVNITAEPFILYISGSDSRGNISETARSDVNILAVINPRTFKMLLVSIPRDYYVQLHGTSGVKDKLTHAGVYGINMSKNTVQDLLNIKINYTAKVGFTTLLNVVDAVDGVDIVSDSSFKRGNCNIKEGTQHLNSECALVYARERYSYSSGDRHRGQNQQQIITALVQKISDPHYLVRYSKILEAAQGSFETSLTYDEITSFARYQLGELRSWKIESISLDGRGDMQPTYSMGSRLLYVMQPDPATIKNAQEKISSYLTATKE